MQVDAIVNAANPDLAIGGGVCGAIFKAADPIKLQSACNKVAPIKTGGAAITLGFNLPAKYIIHAAGPIYSHCNTALNEQLLRSAYIESLKLAIQNGCKRIAFPLISSGIYGYPKEEALRVATAAIKGFLTDHDIDVYLVIFNKAAFAVNKELLGAVENYIDKNYVGLHRAYCHKLLDVECQRLSDAKMAPSSFVANTAPMTIPTGLDNLIDDLDEPFNATLLRLIDAKGKTDTEVYKRANIDRKLFSKIRTGKGYMPSKRTVLALAIALELTLEETNDLLKRAGYALSHSQKFDVIIEYFIISRKYDIFEINEVLFKYDQPLLGGS